MRYLALVWYFLGSIYLAITLIVLTALYTVAGTWIESVTGSHCCAAYYTYGSTFFGILLWGYFVNILISALRRWPFQKRHIPFLMTHLGLLMLLGGAISKHYWGTQGAMALVEGSGNAEIVLPSTYALTVETRQSKNQIPLNQSQKEYADGPLHIKVLEWHPHSTLKQLSWIKNDVLTIRDMPVLKIDGLALPLVYHPQLLVMATTKNPIDLLRHTALLKIANPLTKNPIAEIRLEQFLEEGLTIENYHLQGQLTDNQLVITTRQDGAEQIDQVTYFLDENFQKRSEQLVPRRFLFQLVATPTVAFHSIEKDTPQLSLIGAEGWIKPIPLQENSSIYAYDHGFKGYTTSLETTYPEFEEPKLTSFLQAWQAAGTWLFGNETVSIDLSTASPEEMARWKSRAQLFQQLQKIALSGIDPFPTLKKLLNVDDADQSEILALLDQHSAQFTKEMPTTPLSEGLIYSAALREYGIYPESFITEIKEKPLQFETLIHNQVEPAAPLIKWEDNSPSLLLEVTDGIWKERVALHYDKYGTQLKQPVLKGKYLLRFQSQFEKIPYRLRLSEARQINYPGTNQPLSYEADLWVSDLAEAVKAHLSMNHVYETWDGYRFYLANILPGNRESLQHVQIVVNRDPMKYYLTLPGFFIFIVGVLSLLFFSKKSLTRQISILIFVCWNAHLSADTLSVSGNPAAMVISTAVAGQQPTAVSNSSTTYNVTTNLTVRKITGALSANMPANVTLAVQLAAPTGATSAGSVTMTTTSANLVTSIPISTSKNNLLITYNLSATAAAAQVSGGTRVLTLTLQ